MTTLVQAQGEYKGKTFKFLKGNCKLISNPAEKEAKTYVNDDGIEKSFKAVAVEALLPSGKKMTIPASLHAKTELRMTESNSEFKVGQSYFTQLVPTTGKDGKPTLFARISHFENNSFDAKDIFNEFGDFFAEFQQESAVATEAKPKVAVEA